MAQHVAPLEFEHFETVSTGEAVIFHFPSRAAVGL